MWQGKVGRNFPLESSWDNLVGEKGKMRERKRKRRKEKKEEEKMSEKLHPLSRIYVDFRWSKRKSLTTHCVGTRIQGFRQTPRGRGFSPTLVSLGLRVI